MRRKAAVLLVVAGMAATSAVSVATGAHHAVRRQITVKPASGSPTTRFVVSFRSPTRTGRVGLLDRRDELAVHGPSRRAGCVSDVFRALPNAGAHARVMTTLNPAQLGGEWCVGAYHGQIDEIQGPSCVKSKRCPEFASRVRRLGNFAFLVMSASSGSVSSGNTTPPAFAGLQTASACTPGPQRPGQTTPFTLTWTAATDDITPSSEILYDVFMATAAGGEDFSHPNWTTGPGATVFRTPGLASHGTFFFVVRARDQAGNEDQNRVERRGIDPCV